MHLILKRKRDFEIKIVYRMRHVTISKVIIKIKGENFQFEEVDCVLSN